MILRKLAEIRFKRNSYTQTNQNFANEPIEVSIIVPIFNQENLIVENLEALIKNIGTSSELILINDASEDNSNSVILNFLNSNFEKNPQIKRISYFNFKYPNFETLCDEFGISQSSGKYVIEVQADMKIKHPNFDVELIKILERNPDIFMISGRGVMPLSEISGNLLSSKGSEALINRNPLKTIKYRIFAEKKNSSENSSNQGMENYAKILHPTEEEFKLTGKAGRLGRLIEENFSGEITQIYLGETVMRGPLCFSKDRYDKVGGFNSKAFFLGFDEHDLNLRAREMFEWRAAYVPIRFDSPLEHGAMRKKRSFRSKVEMILALERTKPFIKQSSLYIFAISDRRVETFTEVRSAT